MNAAILTIDGEEWLFRRNGSDDSMIDIQKDDETILCLTAEQAYEVAKVLTAIADNIKKEIV